MILSTHTLAQAAAGVVIAFGLSVYADKRAEWARAAEPIEDWVVQGDIYVPDFVEGDDTLITIQREPIKQPYTSHWSASVITADKNMTDVCDASGFKVYGVGETLPVAGTSMKSMFSVRPCNPEPGKYVARMLWPIHREGYDDVLITRTSNPFTVFPKGTQLSISKEEIQQQVNAAVQEQVQKELGDIVK